jgi:excisionase family DNA binding protein
MTTVDGERRLLLTIEEAAERMGIGRSSMYRLVLSGAVESVKVGRLRRIPEECLRAHIERLLEVSRRQREA